MCGCSPYIWYGMYVTCIHITISSKQQHNGIVCTLITTLYYKFYSTMKQPSPPKIYEKNLTIRFSPPSVEPYFTISSKLP
ncbi:hypothetical protein L249_4510, partial [Ophiocordyceps polyrhachis-furcata BCC 54312]